MISLEIRENMGFSLFSLAEMPLSLGAWEYKVPSSGLPLHLPNFEIGYSSFLILRKLKTTNVLLSIVLFCVLSECPFGRFLLAWAFLLVYVIGYWNGSD